MLVISSKSLSINRIENSQMANKLVQQQLKNVLRGLNDTDIEKILSTYEILSNTQINKNCRMVSYKCYEATMIHKTLTANGYGRTEAEASANCIKNFLEMIMEDEGCLALLIKALKKGNESSSHNVHGRDHHEKSSNVNNTLALNGSYSQVPENNNSFENKKELEILGKNIGNISVIGNHRVSGDVNAANMSQLEMDDLLLKMMLEDGTAVTNSNNNQFRKNLPPQHPNGLDLGGQGSKNYNNIYKTEKASQFSQAAPSTDETKKSLQENTNTHNNQHHPGRYSLDAHAQKDEREENRKENGTPSNQYHKSKSSSSSKQLEGRHSYNHHHHHHADNQKEVAPHRESVGGGHSTNNAKCYCNCSEQLQRANLRIESLEKKLKLLSEENKILKYLTSDNNKEKEYKTDFSTMPSTNGVPTKSPYEKSVGNYDLTTPHENYEDINEFPEREVPQDPTENKRSHSMDVYARKKNFMEHNNQKNVMNYNKENNNSMERRDARKMVPRLKLEMIPNYHAKFSNPSTNVLGHQNTNTQTQAQAQGGATKGYTQQALQNPSTTNFYSQNSFESTLGAGGTLSSLSKYIKK